MWAAISLGVGVIAGVATGIATGDWKKGVAVGTVTTLYVATGGVFAEVAGGAAAAVGMTSTGIALSSSMAATATGTISREVLGNAVLGEKNSPTKIVTDTLRNTAFAAGATAIGIGVNNFINGNSSTYQYGDITRNANYLNPDGTGGTLSQEMDSATANSMSGGCEKALVEYGQNVFNNRNYSERVINRMDGNDNHAFPSSVEAFGGDLAMPIEKIGKDNNPVTFYEIDGSYRGVDGKFEYIFDDNGDIIHRLFRPKK